MDARSIRRRLTRLAVCAGTTAAALAVFTGPASAVGGPPPLVSDKVDLPPTAAPPAVEAVSGNPPVPADAGPPPLDATVEDVGNSVHEIVDAAIPPPARDAVPHVEAPTGGPVPRSETEARGQSASNAPDARPAVPVVARATPPVVIQGAQKEAAPVFSAPPPSAAERVHASPSEARVAAGIRPARFGSPPTPAPARAASHAPEVSATTPKASSSAAPRLPAVPPPTDNGLGGFEIPLPPVAAFALLLALPLGLLALTAPGALGAGLCPDVALLRSADVRFRLVRPG